jgi:ABC-type Fe3+/spermidine/putrescine transport system ATPase subunit
VASFIGQNIVFDGERVENRNEMVKVRTRLGLFSGRLVGPTAETVKLVVPSEAFDVTTRQVGASAPVEVANKVPVTIDNRERSGNLVALRVRLPDGTTIRIEGRVDRFAETIRAGSPAWLQWSAEAGSVIPAQGG